MNGPVGWAGLAVSLLLVAVAAGISWWQRLGLERQILVAAARALAQLLLVGVALTLVISSGRSIWWSWLWVAAMLGYASTVARRRAPEVPHLLPLALASFTAAAVVTLGVLFGLHVFALTGRTLVPIAGMMIGNSMTATVLAGRRLTDELRDKRDEVEARLALGQASRQAATPYVRAALRAALTPQIETTKATGLVFLPGAMTRPHPCRYRPAAGCPGPGRRDVPRAGRHRHHHRGDRPGPDPSPVHPDHRLVYLPAPASH
jgi:putative ABC transport system permease protein